MNMTKYSLPASSFKHYRRNVTYSGLHRQTTSYEVLTNHFYILVRGVKFVMGTCLAASLLLKLFDISLFYCLGKII